MDRKERQARIERAKVTSRLILSSAESSELNDVAVKNLINMLRQYNTEEIDFYLGTDAYIKASLACSQIEERFPDFPVIDAFYARVNQ